MNIFSILIIDFLFSFWIVGAIFGHYIFDIGNVIYFLIYVFVFIIISTYKPVKNIRLKKYSIPIVLLLGVKNILLYYIYTI